jgi:hypothetical protein
LAGRYSVTALGPKPEKLGPSSPLRPALNGRVKDYPE